jgi:hypothetical protein
VRFGEFTGTVSYIAKLLYPFQPPSAQPFRLDRRDPQLPWVSIGPHPYCVMLNSLAMPISGNIVAYTIRRNIL